jgi:hypothetical protein
VSEYALDREAALARLDRSFEAFLEFMASRSPEQSREVLAHVAHWHESCLEGVDNLLAAGPPRAIDVDSANAAWAAEDRDVEWEGSDRRCRESQARLRETVAAIPDESWSEQIVRQLHWDTWNHYAEHTEWLSRDADPSSQR